MHCHSVACGMASTAPHTDDVQGGCSPQNTIALIHRPADWQSGNTYHLCIGKKSHVAAAFCVVVERNSTDCRVVGAGCEAEECKKALSRVAVEIASVWWRRR
jgi:hypothetical protein